MTAQLTLTALDGLPLFAPGDDLVGEIAAGIARADLALADGDVLVIAQKVVSKVEDRFVDLADVTPGTYAIELAKDVDKDPRLVELILSEATEVVRTKPGVLIVAHRLGLVLANAGIDASNVDAKAGAERVLLERQSQAVPTRRRQGPDRPAIRIGELQRTMSSRVVGVQSPTGPELPEPVFQKRIEEDPDCGRDSPQPFQMVLAPPDDKASRLQCQTSVLNRPRSPIATLAPLAVHVRHSPVAVAR